VCADCDFDGKLSAKSGKAKRITATADFNRDCGF
jgi:hypothetical protein